MKITNAKIRPAPKELLDAQFKTRPPAGVTDQLAQLIEELCSILKN
jgi:hypothetical protein